MLLLFHKVKQICMISNQADSTSGPNCSRYWCRTSFSSPEWSFLWWTHTKQSENQQPSKCATQFQYKRSILFWIFLNCINPLPVKPFILRSSHQSLSAVAIYEFMSFSVSMIYICKLKSAKSACLHSQPRYTTVIWGKGWHTGEIPSVRGKKDDDTFFFMMP